MKVKKIVVDYNLQDLASLQANLIKGTLSENEMVLLKQLIEKEESELRKARILAEQYG